MTKQAGLTLAEVLVALTVMTIAGTIALFLYDVSRKSFQKGENATEQQQAVRIAFDELSGDVRLAGFDANPEGEGDSPDDAIEAAFDTAIVLRGNFDAEDLTESKAPEVALAGLAHNSVSVGNDEIVAYVLVSPNGPNTDTLVFQADVGEEPRDGLVETVQIDGVSLVQDNPPYTLYRVTLNKSTAAWGGPDALVRTPLVENIRSLTFRYRAPDGRELNPAFDLSRITDDIGGVDDPAGRRARSSIRRVEVQIEGLTRDPDLSWQDPKDTNVGTRAYRKFQLRGDVTPRNLGRKGLQDLGWDTTPPSKPATPILVDGHCEGLWIYWAPNPPQDEVVAYVVQYTPTGGSPTVNRTIASTGFYLAGLAQGAEYRVRVIARDAAGNQSQPSDEALETTTNDNDPDVPRNILASQTQPGKIEITWSQVTQNTRSRPAADPEAPKIRDLEGYRVLRGPVPDFPRPPEAIVADEKLVQPTTSPAFTDLDAVACREYYYNILSVDLCETSNDSGQDARGQATALAPPAAPAGVTAVRAGAAVRVSWEPTGKDTDGRSAYFDTYNVYRQIVSDGETPADCASGLMEFRGTNDNPLQTTLLDDPAPVVPLGQKIAYRVQAKNDCAGANQLSACSAPAFVLPAGCSFSGEVVIAPPRPGYVVPPLPIRVSVEYGSDVYTGVTLTFLNEEDGKVDEVTLTSAGPIWSYTWPNTARGTYLVKAKVDNSSSCSGHAAIRVRVGL